MPNGEQGVVEEGKEKGEEYPDPPAGWRQEMRGGKMATFTNDEEDLEVIVRAVCSGSKHRPGQREPAHYVVRLHDCGLTLQQGVREDRSAKATTRRQAYEQARSFMEEHRSTAP